jgi:hypothetical protein
MNQTSLFHTNQVLIKCQKLTHNFFTTVLQMLKIRMALLTFFFLAYYWAVHSCEINKTFFQ